MSYHSQQTPLHPYHTNSQVYSNSWQNQGSQQVEPTLQVNPYIINNAQKPQNLSVQPQTTYINRPITHGVYQSQNSPPYYAIPQVTSYRYPEINTSQNTQAITQKSNRTQQTTPGNLQNKALMVVQQAKLKTSQEKSVFKKKDEGYRFQNYGQQGYSYESPNKARCDICDPCVRMCNCCLGMISCCIACACGVTCIACCGPIFACCCDQNDLKRIIQMTQNN